MSDDAGYLSGLNPGQAQELARVNRPGLEALRGYLADRSAVAFLGAGASAPLYPLWAGLIGDLVDAASHRLSEAQAATCRRLAGQTPEEVVEILRRQLGPPEFREALREAFRVRRDPESGRTWTPVHELVCRCAFKAVVTTNYDPGIVDARGRVRPDAVGTGFASWTDEDALDRWRTGDVFADGELPVLFAHGRHTQPEAMVLASTEYRRAYSGKLSRVLGTMIDGGHLVWIGFSFADQRIAAILREVAQASGTRVDPGAAPRHVAILPWDPDEVDNDPSVLAQQAEIGYGAHALFYPAAGKDHSALAALLAELADPRFPPVGAPPRDAAARVSVSSGVPESWTPSAEPVPHFTGRAEELARLSRWAGDPAVRLIGVTAWGGAGKTALVTEWLHRGGAATRPDVGGVFAWSFYADASAEHWAEALLSWAARVLGVRMVGRGRLGLLVLTLLKAVPVILVLDGLEVAQEGPQGGEFGRLLDGTLREVLTGTCRIRHRGLVVLTSRFPFADVEGFDGGAARMLDVPPFTPGDGAALLAATGSDWLPERERRELVAEVDGHALAVVALGAVLADRPTTADLAGLRATLAAAASTNVRVAKVLTFYATRLTDADRYLVAAIALFARPVTPAAVLSLAEHEVFGGRLDGWTEREVEAAARDRLAGLLSWHPAGTLSAHPLVRGTFRPLALGAAEVAADTTLTGVPEGKITNREDGLRLVEAVELLIAADEWVAADNLIRDRTDGGHAWSSLPDARLGLRAESAFVATPQRRDACAGRLSRKKLGWHLNTAGMMAMSIGDLVTARECLDATIAIDRAAGDQQGLEISLRNLADCLRVLGDIDGAMRAAEEATAANAQAGSGRGARNAAVFRGQTLMLFGETVAADERFLAADRIEITNGPESNHLHSRRGVWWAEFLARTGRAGPARTLTDRNRAICVQHGWNASVARCDRLLGSLDLNGGDHAAALERTAAAVNTFRDGDYLTELAEALSLLADCVRAAGDLDAADEHVGEALIIAAPRGLVPAQAAALTVRARIHADRAAAGAGDSLEAGRDAADTAHRLAVRHRLAWCELDALEAHARLDGVAGGKGDWAAQAAAMRARLVPDGLDPDPLGTVERQAAAENAESDDDEW
ncbi:SIR2 family NAD-dependent protein deacylase [Paractinoplanes globisporus]|uniref:SIR2 family protein n=1 Tax=Paractinoplanes globisporus TaxID=113565 RepID=A0ABW6WHP8_9ACTN|nr:SIR2 family protein [Actinoplanes globisporus]